ncbi:Trypsin-like peptidase domain-containing protein [Aliiroseovarius halocynthiae]|uniref:Trypsin-like serine protease n=1 Tax=Aliiroseovarius halocynthiae TaxID=985055 RepID=A0A545SU95_9RHOB|nr:serine protease [Aliiroseovarius halocynthiae]TQV68535.1 trypsin-like serine protease [Aliiroseovarius halocynthiae]SMR70939.1 Trypsin-like peptidase domain-containing protein [Aliiroseovarius halocynthiae]
MKLILPFLLSVWLVPHIAHAQDSAAGLKRLTLRSDLLGFEAVGRLDMPGGFCSGALIASDLVLTAAHCIEDAVAKGSLEGLKFFAGLRDGEFVEASAAKLAVMHPSYDTGPNPGVRNIRYDIGLVVLEAPISTGTAAPFAVEALSQSEHEISVVSYARGRADALSREARCSVMDRDRDLIAFDCDIWFGSSGAPVFNTSGRRPRIVSVVSAVTNYQGQKAGLGMMLPTRLAEVKQALRAGRGVVGGAEVKSRRIGVGGRSDAGARFVKP